tara:strand:- start:10108 stop:10383 length:276 start_codon:yes stop_codon:yes gene_type:complete
MRRSKQDWLNLIQEFEISGLNQTEFCKSQGINPKYFSLKRSRLLPSGNEFVKIKPKLAAPVGTILEHGQVRIHFGQNTPLQQIVDLARELA